MVFDVCLLHLIQRVNVQPTEYEIQARVACLRTRVMRIAANHSPSAMIYTYAHCLFYSKGPASNNVATFLAPNRFCAFANTSASPPCSKAAVNATPERHVSSSHAVMVDPASIGKLKAATVLGATPAHSLLVSLCFHRGPILLHMLMVLHFHQRTIGNSCFDKRPLQ